MVSIYCKFLGYSYSHHNFQSLPYHNLYHLDVGNVAVALHSSGSRSLNSDPSCTLLMENVLIQFNLDYYTVMFLFNRFLYSKFFFA